MYIHEAIKNTSKESPYITREKWAIESASSWLVVILPTDSPDCCILDGYAARRPSRGWQPCRDDLMADDWIVVPGCVIRRQTE